MTVKGPEAIDPAPEGPQRSGGRADTTILSRDAKAAQPPAENSRGRPLRSGDRDAVVLRSHRTHRGLRGRPAPQSGKEPDLAPCLSVAFNDTPAAIRSPECPSASASRPGCIRRRLRPAHPTASPACAGRGRRTAGDLRRWRALPPRPCRRPGLTPPHPTRALRRRRHHRPQHRPKRGAAAPAASLAARRGFSCAPCRAHRGKRGGEVGPPAAGAPGRRARHRRRRLSNKRPWEPCSVASFARRVGAHRATDRAEGRRTPAAPPAAGPSSAP